MTTKPRLTTNIPEPVFRWFRGLEVGRSTTKTRIVVAGILALRALPERERDAMLQWATLFDEEAVSWAEFEKIAGQSDKDRQKSLRDLVERALSRSQGSSPPQSPDRAR